MEGNVTVVEIQKRYWLSLTKGEVRSIGTSRWANKRSKVIWIGMGVTFAIAILGALLNKFLSPFGVVTMMPMVVYYVWIMYSLRQAGRRFLKECEFDDVKGQVKI